MLNTILLEEMAVRCLLFNAPTDDKNEPGRRDARVLMEAKEEIESLRQQLLDDRVSHLTHLGEKQMVVDQLRHDLSEVIKQRAEARKLAAFFSQRSNVVFVGDQKVFSDSLEIVEAWPRDESCW